MCTAEAVSAKVFKLLHYAGLSRIRTLEAVRYVVPANSLEIEVSVQILKTPSQLFTSLERLLSWCDFSFELQVCGR